VDGTPNGRTPAARRSQLLCAKESNNASGTSKINQRREPRKALWLGVRRACHAATVHRVISANVKSCNATHDLGKRRGQYMKVRMQNKHKNQKPVCAFPKTNCPVPGRAADRTAEEIRRFPAV
jgi:hypothetical protein